jgi:hypothetical protein
VIGLAGFGDFATVFGLQKPAPFAVVIEKHMKLHNSDFMTASENFGVIMRRYAEL